MKFPDSSAWWVKHLYVFEGFSEGKWASLSDAMGFGFFDSPSDLITKWRVKMKTVGRPITDRYRIVPYRDRR
jgi:hypothetical protein